MLQSFGLWTWRFLVGAVGEGVGTAIDKRSDLSP